MVAPVEEAPTKVVKVATTVARRPSAKSEETKGSTPAAMDDELHLTALEESFRSTQSGYEGRSAHASRLFCSPSRTESFLFPLISCSLKAVFFSTMLKQMYLL